ncbi:hypothetical protein C8R45DRAFT_956390 [Mycena sanguinolenta]|nr:hypothetical protein C8R45DRAFT_956390 [Mycena sanguinolenta]
MTPWDVLLYLDPVSPGFCTMSIEGARFFTFVKVEPKETSRKAGSIYFKLPDHSREIRAWKVRRVASRISRNCSSFAYGPSGVGSVRALSRVASLSFSDVMLFAFVRLNHLPPLLTMPHCATLLWRQQHRRSHTVTIFVVLISRNSLFTDWSGHRGVPNISAHCRSVILQIHTTPHTVHTLKSKSTSAKSRIRLHVQPEYSCNWFKLPSRSALPSNISRYGPAARDTGFYL